MAETLKGKQAEDLWMDSGCFLQVQAWRCSTPKAGNELSAHWEATVISVPKMGKLEFKQCQPFGTSSSKDSHATGAFS